MAVDDKMVDAVKAHERAMKAHKHAGEKKHKAKRSKRVKRGKRSKRGKRRARRSKGSSLLDLSGERRSVEQKLEDAGQEVKRLEHRLRQLDRAERIAKRITKLLNSN